MVTFVVILLYTMVVVAVIGCVVFTGTMRSYATDEAPMMMV